MRGNIRTIATLCMMTGAVAFPLHADEKEKENASDSAQHSMICTSETMGATVVDDNDETIATIDNLIVLRDGTVAYAVLGQGGVLGVGQDHYAVPVERLRIHVNPTEDGARTVRFHLPGMTKDRLAKAPALKETGYPELFDETWVAQNAKFFEVDALEMDRTKGLMFGSEILDANIYDLKGKDLAAIDYVMWDPAKPQLTYLVVDHETTLTDNELVPIPLHAVMWTRNDDRDLIPRVDTTMETLNAAPRVKVGDYTYFTAEEFEERVHGVFPKRSEKRAN